MLIQDWYSRVFDSEGHKDTVCLRADICVFKYRRCESNRSWSDSVIDHRPWIVTLHLCANVVVSWHHDGENDQS